METNSDRIKEALNPQHAFDFKTSFQKKLTKKNGYLSSVSTLALAGCGGGGGEAENSSGASHNLPNKKVYDLTGDVVIDSMTQGSKWLFSDGTDYGYAVAGSPGGIQFSDADKISNVYKNDMQFFSDLTQASLVYSGVSSTPSSAYSQGNEFVITMDGASVGKSFNGSASGALAMAGFPIVSWERPYATFAGDILLNYDSSLPYYYNESTAEGSLFNFVVVHELGHVFGLKHPHDDGGSGRPVFGEYGGLSRSLDNDLYTVMSYKVSHGGDTSATKYDPSTFMVLDVLALQYLYGKNLATNSGDTVHKIDNVDSFRSLWDPSGNNTVDVSNSSTDWYVVLPYYVWSDLANEPTGYAVTYKNPDLTLPTDLVWLVGDFDNITTGGGDDTLIGNSFANSLVGGSGDDRIEGWEGDDTLFGGTGNDTFYFAIGWGTDSVEDFNSEGDTIVLLDEFLDPIDFNDVKVEVADTKTTFTLSENSKLVVKNFDYFANQDILDDDNLSSESENDKNTEDTSSEQASNTAETESNDTLATADTLEMGTVIFGQLSSSADLDYYTFTAAQASTLRLAFDVPTSSSYNLYFTASVIDAAGNFLSSQQVGSDLSFSTALNSGGTYYVQIEDSSFYNGEQYSLTGSLLNGTSGRETESNDTIATADTLASGGSAKGQLWWKTDQDFYRVATDGASTISVTLDAPTNSSYNNYFKVSLQNASGTVLSSQETGSDITFDTGVTSAGDYYIVIEDSDFHVTEEYAVSVSVNASEQASNTAETESNDTLATADTLEMGTVIFGQLSSSADLDYYTFTAAQASTLRLAFDVPTSSSYNLYFTASVIDAAGNFLSSQQVGSDLSFSTALNSGGTYYVQIEDSSFYNGEQYSLTGSLLNGTSGRETESNDTIATADTLASGGSAKGQLWWKTDQDFYRVATDGASTISVTLDAPTNSSYNNYFKVSLQNASGTVLSSQETGSDITFDTGVTSAGDYYIVIEDSDFHVTEEYAVSVSVNASEQASNTAETESNDTLATADTLEMGTVIFGQLSSSADLDYYTFTAAQASTLRLAFDVPTSSSYNLYFTASVIDAAGNFLSSQQVGSDLSFSTALNSGGTYYVQIEDSSFYNGEQYSLTGSLLNGTSGRETESNDTIATADTLASGGSAKGQLWWKTDQDFYRVATDGASTISVTLDAPTNSSYNNYFKVSLQNASGTVLSSQETGSDITFDTGVTSAGDYYIVIEDSDYYSSQDYSISTSIIM